MYLLIVLLGFAAYILIASIFFHHKFNPGEAIVQGIGTAFVLSIVYMLGYSSQTYDIKIENSVIKSKEIVEKQCDMTWDEYSDPFCTNQQRRSVKTGQSCTTVDNRKVCTDTYTTEYRSIYPWERKYYARAENGYDFQISREDAQGAVVPARYTSIKIGDPVAVEVSYTNYIKGAASTILNPEVTEKTEIAYPRVRDYYNAARVIYTATKVDPVYLREWIEEFNVLNSELRKTGANVILLVTGNKQVWAEQLARGWDAHNINDIVIVIGSSSGNTIDWVDVRSWSKNELVDVTLRDELLNLKTIDKSKINDIILRVVKENYVLQDPEAFEYLAEDVEMPSWTIYVIGLLLLISPLITYFFYRNDF